MQYSSDHWQLLTFLTLALPVAGAGTVQLTVI